MLELFESRRFRMRTIVRRTSFGQHSIATQDQDIVLYHSVDAGDGDTQLAIVQACNPILFQQVPDVKFEMLGRAGQQALELNDTHSTALRISTAGDIQQRKNAFKDSAVIVKAV